VNHQTTPERGAQNLVGVDATMMRELAHHYVEYLQSLTGRDPVKTLSLAGDILSAVRRIVTAPAQHVTVENQRGAVQE
jgi:hypothetical protein